MPTPSSSVTVKGVGIEVTVDSLEKVIRVVNSSLPPVSRLLLTSVNSTTPPVALVKSIGEYLVSIGKRRHVALNVLVRPRLGDYCYNPQELNDIAETIEACNSLNVDGITIGVLTRNLTVEKDVLEVLLNGIRKECQVSFDQEAFDLVNEPFKGLDDLASLKRVERIYSSGQNVTALNGVTLLQSLMMMASEVSELLFERNEMSSASSRALSIIPKGAITMCQLDRFLHYCPVLCEIHVEFDSTFGHYDHNSSRY